MTKLIFISLKCIHGRETNIILRIGNLQLYMYTALYTRKQGFCKNVKFELVALALHSESCFNASLSGYTL